MWWWRPWAGEIPPRDYWELRFATVGTSSPRTRQWSPKMDHNWPPGRLARGVQFRFAAAVGGGVPVLEAIRRLADEGPLRSISGVFNGTCNFVLDRMGEGASLADAVRRAQARGLAEADPSDDLQGIDAARKLVLVCQEAFGVRLQTREFPCIGIHDLDTAALRKVQATWPDGSSAIASCTRKGQGAGRRGWAAAASPYPPPGSLPGCREPHRHSSRAWPAPPFSPASEPAGGRPAKVNTRRSPRSPPRVDRPRE